jgi:hypothetical protein
VGPLVRRRAAQVAAAAFCALAAPAFGAPERGIDYTCAGDGRAVHQLELSGLVEGFATAWAGPDANLRDPDATDQAGVTLGAARIMLCGRWNSPRGRVFYHVGYEPWNRIVRAEPNSTPWGTILAAEVGWWPWTWIGFYFGVRKLELLFGHDEPEEALTLPFRPYITTSVAPDRRWGFSIDDDFGVAHITLGIYEAAQDLVPSLQSGLLITARLRAEPIGPVGYTLSTIYDDPNWRKRPRFAVNASILLEYTSENSGYLFAADIPIKWGPLGIGAEYVYAVRTLEEGPIRAPAPVWSRQGAWAGLALMMWRPYLELGARYDYLNVPSDRLRQFSAFTFGLNGYLWRTRAKLQVAYTHKFRGVIDDALMFMLTLTGSVTGK